MTVGRPHPVVIAILAALIVAVATIVPAGNSPAGELIDPKPCPKAVAKQGLRDFVKAYNRGNFEKLDRMFTEDPQFLNYSIGRPGVRSKPRDRTTLIPYFKARHRQHDRLHVRHFSNVREGHGFPFFERSTHFAIYLARRADDFNRGRWFRISGGKGAMVCEGDQPKIFLMAIGERVGG